MKEFKTQLNRIEGKLNQIIDLLDPNFYQPSQAEIDDIKQFAAKMNKDWFDSNPYIKFEHSGNGKWERITSEMRVRAIAAARAMKSKFSEEDITFLSDTVGNPDNATDLTEGQIKKLNALLYQFYQTK